MRHGSRGHGVWSTSSRASCGPLPAQFAPPFLCRTARPSWSALVVCFPADGKHSVILDMHGGGFLTCGAHSHGRLVTALSKYADSPVLVVNTERSRALRGAGARRLL